MKDYLGFENARNKRNAALYERLLRLALGSDAKVAVLIGHHITFELDNDLSTENEIPSADCLMFDHELMGRVFGKLAVPIMQSLVARPCEERDALLAEYLSRKEVAATV